MLLRKNPGNFFFFGSPVRNLIIRPTRQFFLSFKMMRWSHSIIFWIDQFDLWLIDLNQATNKLRKRKTNLKWWELNLLFDFILFRDSQINQNKLKAKNLIQLKWIFGDQKKFLLFFMQDSFHTHTYITHIPIPNIYWVDDDDDTTTTPKK